MPSALAQHGLLNSGESALFGRVIGFRNVAVHGYGAIDSELVKKILEGGLYRDLLRLTAASC